MSCSTCNGRGWVPRFKGDHGGDLCLACADDLTLRLVASTTPAKRRRSYHADAHWTVGEKRSGAGVVSRGRRASRRSYRRTRSAS